MIMPPEIPTPEQRLTTMVTVLIRSLEHLQTMPPIQRKVLIEREVLPDTKPHRELAYRAGESGDTDLLPPRCDTMQDLDATLNELEQLSIAELRQRFADVLGYRSNSRSHEFLIRKILWGIQAKEHGDISDAAKARALEMADARVLHHRMSRNGRTKSVQVVHRRLSLRKDHRLPTPGTILTRQYQGRNIAVSVLEDGFDWRGRKFKSLSAVAREITGTRWNGFAFFELGKAA